MGTISLEGMAFFARHGFYEEERKLGNRYSVDIIVEADFTRAAESDELSGTVDYQVLYDLVRDAMEQPAYLLEHLAGRIIDRTYAAFPHIQAVEVSVSKYNPPVGGVCERSRVTLRKAATG